MSDNPVVAKAVAAITGLTAYAPGKPIEELQRELGLTDVAKLASNENPSGPSPLGLAAAQEVLADVWLYPDGAATALKAKLCERHLVTAEQIVIGNGSSEILDLLSRVFLAPGRNAVFSQYSFAMYPLNTMAAGADCNIAAADGLAHDLKAMAAAIDENTRVVFLANPNNPTGTWFDRAALLEFMAEVPADVLVVLDEAYFEYVDEADYPDGVTLLADFPNLMVTRTFSKAYGLAGLRIGYALCAPEIADLLNRLRLPFNGSVPALAAATAALDDVAHVQTSKQLNQRGLLQLQQGCDELGLSWQDSVANFLLIQLPSNAMPVYETLLKQGLIVRPLGAALANYIRVSTGTAEQNQRFLAALAGALQLPAAAAS